MPSASVAAHDGLPFANPLAEADVDAAIGALDPPPGALVLETGCGGAELLIRVLERHPSARGLGVDPDPGWLERARAAARERLPGRDVAFVAATAAGAGLEPGGYDVVVNVASSHAHGGFPAALGELRTLVRDGGSVLLGEGFWAREPSAAFLDALGGATPDELGSYDELLAAARAAGFDVAFEARASEADWARYEEGLAERAERAGGAEAAEYARRIRERRALPGGTDTLGFALLVLRA
jgi:SAM-dependent methyltransferase